MRRLFRLLSGKWVVWGMVAGLLSAGVLIGSAPASLLDRLIRHHTNGQAALLMSEGSVWQGKAQLALLDPVQRRYRRMLPVVWKWRAADLLHGHLVWQFSGVSALPVEFSLALSGLRMGPFTMQMPARPVLEQMPGMVGRLGWRGDLQVRSPAWSCGWTSGCDGTITLHWLRSALDILPEPELGDYTLNLTARSQSFMLDVHTTSGVLQIDAQGAWPQGSRPRLSGTLRGEPEMLSRFSGAAGAVILRGSEPDKLLFSF